MMAEQIYKMSIAKLAFILTAFMAISFILCVAAGYVLPGLRGLMPLNIIPGFSWANPLTGIMGLVWSIGFGAYVAILFGVLFNVFGGVTRGS